ncbi:hypothetical protein O7622_19540 [Micromonospora sp. WMMD1076]|uniref:hypothetical protein n=1 Tax=Micromonospora sp. WMMD1076 TaxID=3016103 RepID=UPI00249CDB6D|nr:hypothetical protein [Micromonospora sp. WMMD1076]WFF05247.1 hypothetical protein O7622_19540 [Micromonospora sp. WMMD1076]
MSQICDHGRGRPRATKIGSPFSSLSTSARWSTRPASVTSVNHARSGSGRD